MMAFFFLKPKNCSFESIQNKKNMIILRNFLILFIFCYSLSLNAQWEEISLPNGRSEICSVALDDNIYFIGGALSGVERYKFMDVYNAGTNSWSTIEMPNPTKAQTCVAIDKKLYIGIWSDRVIDVYDTEDGSWSALTPPPLRVGQLIHMDSLLIVGNSGDLGIYNFNTSEWNFMDRDWRSGNAIAAANGKIVLAGGGGTDDVSIYDIATDTWTTSKLSIARDDLRGAGHGNRVFFIGGEADGFDWTNRIDVYNTETDTWSIDSMSRARLRFDVNIYKNKLYVVGGQIISFSGQYRDEVDIFDLNSNTWETVEMPTGRRYPSAVGHENKLYIAGGDDSQDNLDIVEILELETSSTEVQDLSVLKVYPNPTSEFIIIESELNVGKVNIFNINGELIFKDKIVRRNRKIDVSEWPAGVYFVQSESSNHLFKIIKM